ncbi:hypothetical protein FGO68_gene3910 [Halteria grandinella]|uniref:Uncharacterized protein n=1 Tax=Halteria grandinella TaxID=5974 RepID=A0A8J8SZM8_HALGN|nr:hypothetical protein FGO68_gene3910 [Halteria grandinella]
MITHQLQLISILVKIEMRKLLHRMQVRIWLRVHTCSRVCQPQRKPPQLVLQLLLQPSPYLRCSAQLSAKRLARYFLQKGPSATPIADAASDLRTRGIGADRQFRHQGRPQQGNTGEEDYHRKHHLDRASSQFSQ